MKLTAEDYRAKIEMVKQDIEKLQSMGGDSRKSSTLADYIDYLKDELKEAELAERTNKGT